MKQLLENNNKWMKYLNSQVKVNLNNLNEITENAKKYSLIKFEYKKNVSFINEIYEYPEEDFCLFQHFPHDHLVYPMLVPGKKIKCSCTVLWLVQYYTIYISFNFNPNYVYNYENSKELNLWKTILYCHDENLYHNIRMCNFSKRISL